MPFVFPIKRVTRAAFAAGVLSFCSSLGVVAQASAQSVPAEEALPPLQIPIKGWFCAPPKTKLTLDLTTPGFSNLNAYWLSWAAVQSYGGDLFKSGKLASVGLTQSRFFSNKSTGLLGFVAANDDAVVVSYSGTSDLRDVFHDLGFNLRSDCKYNVPGKVHQGFLAALDRSWPEIYKTILDYSDNGRKKVFLSGHSLGAAMSTLSAARLLAAGFEVGGAYLFSTPRVGDREFADAFNAQLNNRVFRFRNNEDIIPRLPPPAEAAEEFSNVFTGPLRGFLRATFLQNNYTHVGQNVSFDVNGKLTGPSPYEESDDAKYWTHLTDRSRTLRPVEWLLTNWRLVGDHIPASSFCYIKLGQ